MTLRDFAISVLFHFDWFVFWYFIVVNGFYSLLLALSVPELFSNFVVASDENMNRMFASELAPQISILAPAFNERTTIVDSINAMFALEYPALEIVIVNDGSTDETVRIMTEEFELFEVPPAFKRIIETQPVRKVLRSRKHANLIVVDKENGGKADALNAGLNISSSELICCIDADTLIERDALLRIIRPFYLHSDVIAAGGTIRIGNDCIVKQGRVVEVRPPKKYLPAVQVVEYLRAFLFGRLGLNRLGGNLVISGAFGLFRKDIVMECGGYLKDTVGEDMELVVRMHRYMRENNRKYRVEFIPDPVAWTETPDTIKILARQRDRWHRGLTDAMLRHKKMLFNPRYGMIGLVVYPYFFFVELLAPIIEVAGYIGLIAGLYYNAVDWFFALMFFLAAYGLGTVLSLFSLVLEEATFRKYTKTSHILYLILITLVENLNYRQMTVFWRLNGIIKYIRGTKSWGHMDRRGFSSEKKS